MINCPDCHSEKIVKNGSLTNGKPKYKCKVCHRQFVLNPKKHPISNETKAFIDKLINERISLAGIARVTGVSEPWLQKYVNDKYKKIPQTVTVSKTNKGRLKIECDELWSLVKNKDNKQWIGLAIDQKTREIIGVAIGDRRRQTSKKLWDSFPAVYRQCALCYTDFWEAYQTVFPSTRHQATGKESGKTSHIERLNCTLRQRVSR